MARAQRCLEAVRARCQPRVVAALLRTWFNGWVSLGRMQQSGGCVFGCCREDRIRQYAFCPAVRSFSEARLRLAAPPRPALYLETFLGLGEDTGEQLVQRAVALFSVYKLHCRLRHGAPRPGNPADALWQLSREAWLGGLD